MSYPTCSEGDHVNDDNPGRPMCKTCEDWIDPPTCITCGAPLTADDPVVTTLGPRCKRHF